jgi:predicted nuclease with TOPRIM domain
MNDDDYVFAISYDPRRPLNRDKVGFAFRQTLRKNGLLAKDQSGRGYTYSLHSFRRSYESNLARAGVHPMVIKFLLGHSQGVEDHYLRLDEKTLFNEWKKAEPILRLDVEEKETEGRVAELERQVEEMRQTISELREIAETYMGIVNQIRDKYPALLDLKLPEKIVTPSKHKRKFELADKYSKI